MIEKPIEILTRAEIEDYPEKTILKNAAKYNVALLVPGDPMNATTHVDLCVRANEMGIKTSIIHAASITSAAPGVTGLQSYKFGRTVTIPIPQNTPPLSPYDRILENYRRGLHTLILLDVDVENEKFLLISKAIKQLNWMEKKKKQGLITPNRLIIGAARIGGPDMEVKSGRLNEISRYDFKGPPHTMIFPGALHFMEEEALKLTAI
jgi:diphthine synthase